MTLWQKHTTAFLWLDRAEVVSDAARASTPRTMGNSLDCGLGDCGSPDDAETSDYSKPVEYDQVQRRRPKRFSRRGPRAGRGAPSGRGARPAAVPGGGGRRRPAGRAARAPPIAARLPPEARNVAPRAGEAGAGPEEDPEQPRGPPAPEGVLRGLENGHDPAETAGNVTKNAGRPRDGPAVVAVGRAALWDLRSPAAARKALVFGLSRRRRRAHRIRRTLLFFTPRRTLYTSTLKFQ